VRSHKSLSSFLNSELSLLRFQRRVLALANDPRTPEKGRREASGWTSEQ
jgi:polyphosphate kinase